MDYVTAKQAADMTGLAERTIRRMIADGKLPAESENARRYRIAVKDLPRRKVDALEELRAEVKELRLRVEVLERRQTRSEGREAAWPREYLPVDIATPERSESRHRATYSGYQTAMSSAPVSSSLPTKAHAARFLKAHGIPENTGRDWSEWEMEDFPITPRRAIEVVLELKQTRTPSRQPKVFRPCGDPSCICHELLPSAPVSASKQNAV